MLPEIITELTDEQKQALADARRAIPKLREQIRRAKLAGLDMSAEERQLTELEAQITKIYQVYVRRGAGMTE